VQTIARDRRRLGGARGPDHIPARLAKASDREVTERVTVANSPLMDDTPLVDAFHPTGQPVAVLGSGFRSVVVPPRTTLVLKPREQQLGGYRRYKRVR
jgi:hypothetical protein